MKLSSSSLKQICVVGNTFVPTLTSYLSRLDDKRGGTEEHLKAEISLLNDSHRVKQTMNKMFDHMEAGNKTENKSDVNQDEYVYMSY